jgi:hypothetical protein
MYRVIHKRFMLATQQQALVEADYEVAGFTVNESGVLVLYDKTDRPLKAIPPGLWLDIEHLSLVDGAPAKPKLVTP